MGEFRAIARRRWPRAAWITGDGPHASVSLCHHGPDHDEPCSCVTVMLFEDHAEAVKAKAEIDRMACGGRCERAHRLVNLADQARMTRDDELRAQFASRLKAETATGEQRRTNRPVVSAGQPQPPVHHPFDEALGEQPYCLYRYFDACGCLLYVGITDATRLGTRDREHANNSPWHALAVRREVAEMPDKQQAADAEREAVRAESPAFNSALRDSRATNAALTRYLLSHAAVAHA